MIITGASALGHGFSASIPIDRQKEKPGQGFLPDRVSSRIVKLSPSSGLRNYYPDTFPAGQSARG
jgi:hypothetical protein